MTESDQLQRQLNLMRGEPVVPLTEAQAIQHAYSLRIKGVSYRDLRLVMGIYHGHWYCAERWRDKCRALGAPVRKGAYRGRPRRVES